VGRTNRTLFYLILFFSVLLATREAQCRKPPWPVMANFSAKVGIETSAEHIFFEFPLKDVHGRTQYTFVCVGGSTEYLDKLGDESNVNYVGPLSCRLVEGDKDAEKNEASLLSEDDSAYWFSRGQIHDFQDLVGACGKYPEYGALRHFRLRGFELTLYSGDILVDKAGHPSYFTLTVSLRRDATALSPTAKQTGYLTPYKAGSSCTKILKGNELRMCRDWKHLGGSYTECNKITH
jgi:hypothetical protein